MNRNLQPRRGRLSFIGNLDILHQYDWKEPRGVPSTGLIAIIMDSFWISFEIPEGTSDVGIHGLRSRTQAQGWQWRKCSNRLPREYPRYIRLLRGLPAPTISLLNVYMVCIVWRWRFEWTGGTCESAKLPLCFWGHRGPSLVHFFTFGWVSVLRFEFEGQLET